LRNTGGTVFLDAAAGSAVSSNNLFLGNASRDGHTSMFLQLSRSNQIADNTGHLVRRSLRAQCAFQDERVHGSVDRRKRTTETIAGVSDFTGQGVIENTQDEADFNFKLGADAQQQPGLLVQRLYPEREQWRQRRHDRHH